jgi:putative membrane protein
MHYSPTLAFFIGLILPSIAIPWSMMDRRGLALLWAIPGIALTLGVSFVIPDAAAGSDHLLLALLTGAIAISAMILPGLSGSYIMLIMGQYQNVLDKLTGLQRSLGAGRLDLPSIVWLACLAAGMAVGIVLFARLLHFLLARFRAGTMAFLIGLLIGSLWVLWPFKEIDAGARIEDRRGQVKQEVQIATAPNRLPRTVKESLLAGGAGVAGLIGSSGLILLGRRRREV